MTEIRKQLYGRGDTAHSVYEYFDGMRWNTCFDQVEAERVYKQQKNTQYGKISGTKQIGEILTSNGLDYVWNGNNWVPKWISDPVMKDLLAD